MGFSQSLHFFPAPHLHTLRLAIGLAVLVLSAPAQMLPDAPKEEPLVDSELVIMKGVVRPSHTRVVNGKEVVFSEGCAFRFVLPPGQKALHWHRLGRPRIDKNKNTCDAAFEVGIPARFAGVVVPNEAPTWSSGYFSMWWTDPINYTVTWARAEITWGWERLLCAIYQNGDYFDWWNVPTGWQLVGHGPIGSVTGGCSEVGYTGTTFLANQSFPPCNPLAPMYLEYNPVQVFGTADGYLWGYGHTEASGPGLCYLLLSPHFEIVRTWN